MKTHTIRKGFDLCLEGAPEASVVDAPEPTEVGVLPPEFPGIKPKLLVKEGDQVTTGQPLFFDKFDRDAMYSSPGTGVVARVELGARRVPQRIVVQLEGEDTTWSELPSLDRNGIDKVSRGDVIAALKGAGLWPMLRQRPLGITAKSDQVPSAIYVNGMDTEPNAADPAVQVSGRGEALQAGVDLLQRLTDGVVRLTTKAGISCPEFSGMRGVEHHEFAGSHPAGLVGTHIHSVEPLKDGQVAWCLRAQDCVEIGEWLLTGSPASHRVVALSGSRMPEPQHVRVRRGAGLASLPGIRNLAEDVRLIKGTVLNGTQTDATGFLGFGTQTVTAIPEGADSRELLGWMLPQPGKASASRSTFSWLIPGKRYSPDARVNGGPRGNVNIGQLESVLALDIYPTFLMRAIEANDLEEALNLGLLEVTEEDVALCTFVDPCKRDVGAIIRKGLEMYEAES